MESAVTMDDWIGKYGQKLLREVVRNAGDWLHR
jgi:hypothetical protein